MMIKSMLDTDLYKLSMAAAVAHHYPHVEVEYEFINRNDTPFPVGFGQELRKAVDAMQELGLTGEEEKFLREHCYYLKPNYIDMFRGYRYDPKQVTICQVGTALFVTIRGPWYLTIYYEVPLLAMISELYYKMMDQPPFSGWEKTLKDKLDRMSDAGCIVSDFGTRRRHSFRVHDHVVKTLAGVKCCAGTSNVHLAQKYNLTPIGTMAHEFLMGHAAMYGYRAATQMALKSWAQVYDGNLGIALPDTFTTDVFLREFGTFYGRLFDGVRHDSGDWKEFTKKIVEHYKTLRIDPASKTIVYSDSLKIETILEIHKYVNGSIRDRYGVGTHLTNDVGRTPLNIVIKLMKCDGRPCIKLSDSPGKALGLPDAVSYCKYSLQLQ